MNALLELNEISVSLGGRAVLNKVSLKAAQGEFVGLIGPNGAGKSTLLRAAAGLAAVEEGTRRIAGESIDALPPRERARKLAYLPQSRPVYWAMPARAIVALGRFAYGDPLTEDARDNDAIDHALDACAASHLAERPAAELSGGELARIHLARALAGRTPLLLADEPVAALDPEHQLSVLALLKRKAEENGAVIAALHDLPLAARYCTRLVVLNEGGIAFDGAPDKVPAEVYAEIFKVTPVFGDAGRLLMLS